MVSAVSTAAAVNGRRLSGGGVGGDAWPGRRNVWPGRLVGWYRLRDRSVRVDAAVSSGDLASRSARQVSAVSTAAAVNGRRLSDGGVGGMWIRPCATTACDARLLGGVPVTLAAAAAISVRRGAAAADTAAVVNASDGGPPPREVAWAPRC